MTHLRSQQDWVNYKVNESHQEYLARMKEVKRLIDTSNVWKQNDRYEWRSLTGGDEILRDMKPIINMPQVIRMDDDNKDLDVYYGDVRQTKVVNTRLNASCVYYLSNDKLDRIKCEPLRITSKNVLLSNNNIPYISNMNNRTYLI